jgi:dCMP deaminase
VNRPTFFQIYMGLAESMAQRSTCARGLKVGCVITTPDFRKVLAVGYNGNAAGGPNDCDRHGEKAVGNCGCIHAEANAVINCDAPRGTKKVVFVTHLPCVTCAKFLINLGDVEALFYKNDYRIKESLRWLSKANIVAGHLPESGDILEAFQASAEDLKKFELEESRRLIEEKKREAPPTT